MQKDFISDLKFNPDKNLLLSVAGDSTMCAYDLRKTKRSVQSEEQESELTCVEWMRGGSKAVMGTDDGVLLLFSKDRWLDCSDRFIGHQGSVDCMLKLDEYQMLTGGSDGAIRLVSVLPNKILGVIGETGALPVEGLYRGEGWAGGPDSVIASFSLDKTVRFWDPSCIDDINARGASDSDDDSDDDSDNDSDDDSDDNGGDNGDNDGDVDGSAEEEEAEEGDDEEEEEGGNYGGGGDSEDDDSDNEPTRVVGKKVKRGAKQQAKPKGRRATENFFSDL
jgi:WD40 repeat protein